MINLKTWHIYNPIDLFIQNQILNELNMDSIGYSSN